MHIIKSGSTIQIYSGDDIQTFSELPIGTYEVGFNKMMGFYLTTHSNLIAKEEKIYGSTIEKISKVIKSYNLSQRNFGIILSGKKGSGKTLFAKKLSEECIKNNMPVIIVSDYHPGIASFLGSIEQEVMILFDEFDKTFMSTTNDGDKLDLPQEELLSLFDGIDTGKKLFVITCNDSYQLNNYLINRPGRFHYHFNLTNLSPEEVIEYMEDNLIKEHSNVINRVINLLVVTDITYDVLRAIVFELNQGYDLEETLADLNIKQKSYIGVNLCVITESGEIYENSHCDLDFLDKVGVFFLRNIKNRNKSVSVSFNIKDIKFNGKDIHLPLDKCEFTYHKDNGDTLDKEKTVKFIIEKIEEGSNFKLAV